MGRTKKDRPAWHMTPEEFRGIQLSLSDVPGEPLEQDELGEMLGVSDRQIRRYRTGTSPIPGPVAKLTRRLLEEHFTVPAREDQNGEDG